MTGKRTEMPEHDIVSRRHFGAFLYTSLFCILRYTFLQNRFYPERDTFLSQIDLNCSL